VRAGTQGQLKRFEDFVLQGDCVSLWFKLTDNPSDRLEAWAIFFAAAAGNIYSREAPLALSFARPSARRLAAGRPQQPVAARVVGAPPGARSWPEALDQPRGEREVAVPEGI